MIDLHTHSSYSDGTLTPAALVSLAAEAGLSAVALTDHNTVAGLGEFFAADCPDSLERVAGVEFSTKDRGYEYHILALFLPRESWDSVRDYCSYWHGVKEENNRLLAERLNRAGYAVDYDRMRRDNPGEINRSHFAVELARMGHAESVQDAFLRYLQDGEGFFTEPPKARAEDVIRRIAAWDAAAVLAHPLLYVGRETLDEFLPRAVRCGLVGMETEYPLFDRETRDQLSRLATELGLCESGGSDFHGERKPDISIGTGRGDLAVPDGFLAPLKARSGVSEDI